jgi:hypothetical protein
MSDIDGNVLEAAGDELGEAHGSIRSFSRCSMILVAGHHGLELAVGVSEPGILNLLCVAVLVHRPLLSLPLLGHRPQRLRALAGGVLHAGVNACMQGDMCYFSGLCKVERLHTAGWHRTC